MNGFIKQKQMDVTASSDYNFPYKNACRFNFGMRLLFSYGVDVFSAYIRDFWLTPTAIHPLPTHWAAPVSFIEEGEFLRNNVKLRPINIEAQ